MGEGTSRGKHNIRNTSELGGFYHLATDGDSASDIEPDQEGDDHYPAAFRVEEAKAAGMWVALDVFAGHAQDGSDTPAWTFMR